MDVPAGASPSDPVRLGEEILRACGALGFASAGIARARPAARPGAVLGWIGAGRHGRMDWMTERLDQRLDIGRLLPGAKSVVMVADRYAVSEAESGASEPGQNAVGPSGRIARYARGRDYHDVVKRRLQRLADRLRAEHPGIRCRVFVDSAPVLEREHAARAGLGFIGKHTLLIEPRAGSYLVLGGFATTLELSPPGDPAAGEDHCGTCTRCIDACPTGAISPYSVDATRCISYLTIEHEGLIDQKYHRAMGDWIFGCDVCQEVCPFNSTEHVGGPSRVNPSYRTREGLKNGRLDLLDVLGWTADRRQAVLTVSAGKRATLGMIRRNAAIASVNALERGSANELRQRLEQLACNAEEDPIVRETAKIGLSRLAELGVGTDQSSIDSPH